MKVDMYGIGAPCQGFSKSGYNKGMADKRSRPLKHGYRFVKKHRPKVFRLEHVPPFSSLKHVATKNKIMKKLKAIGDYRIKERRQKTNEIGIGHPQNRTRIYILGFRKDVRAFKHFRWPMPAQEAPLSLADVMDPVDSEDDLQPNATTMQRNWTNS